MKLRRAFIDLRPPGVIILLFRQHRDKLQFIRGWSPWPRGSDHLAWWYNARKSVIITSTHGPRNDFI